MNTTYLPGFGDAATWGPVMDPRDPRSEDDGEFHNEQSALDQATDDVMATPWEWQWFLSDVCGSEEPVNTASVDSDFFAGDASTEMLLVLVLDSSDWDVVREARAELRDRFRKYAQRAIEDRAAALVGEPV